MSEEAVLETNEELESPSTEQESTTATPNQEPDGDQGSKGPQSLESIGERLKTQSQSDEDDTPAETSKSTDTDAETTSNTDWFPKEGITFKGNGKENVATSLDEAKKLMAAGVGYQKKVQELRNKFEESMKPHRIITETAKEYPAVKKVIQHILNDPSLADAYLEHQEARVRNGEYHPSELKAKGYERREKLEQATKAQREQETQAQKANEEGLRILNEHLVDVSEEAGKKVEVGDPYFKELWQFMQESGVKDIRKAHKLYLVETGEYDKRLEAKKAKEAELAERQRKASGIRGGKVSGSSASDLTGLEAIGRLMQKPQR